MVCGPSQSFIRKILVNSLASYLTEMVGNVLAGYLATKMGLPVDKLVGMTIPDSLQWIYSRSKLTCFQLQPTSMYNLMPFSFQFFLKPSISLSLSSVWEEVSIEIHVLAFIYLIFVIISNSYDQGTIF